MHLCDLTPSYVRAIAPYQPGKPISELAREMGIAERDIVKLASNENPRGVSPLAAAAMRAVLDDLARYPDGNGSNDVLDIAARVFLAPGTSAIYSQHAFAVYPIAAQTVGAHGIEVPARAFGHDLDAMLAAVRPDTRVVFIANPNNPTGTFLRGPQLLAFLQALPASVALVLDEAYTEYLAEEVRYDSIGWLARFPNLIVTRTFSKAYGLAGLRVGYALAHPPVADLMNRVRQPFNVNSLSLAAATAALGDAEFVRSSHELNLRGMRQLTDGFARLGVEYIPSYGNFVSCRVGDGGAVFERLLRRGVIVRPIGGYGMPEYLRVSVGLESENARLLAALAECLARG